MRIDVLRGGLMGCRFTHDAVISNLQYRARSKNTASFDRITLECFIIIMTRVLSPVVVGAHDAQVVVVFTLCTLIFSFSALIEAV